MIFIYRNFSPAHDFEAPLAVVKLGGENAIIVNRIRKRTMVVLAVAALLSLHEKPSSPKEGAAIPRSRATSRESSPQ